MALRRTTQCGVDGPRPTSTKTRIKTPKCVRITRLNSPRPTSTKTRIKTPPCRAPLYRMPVRDQHPLKQGLRPNENYLLEVLLIVRDQHPLKQGLRHFLLVGSVVTLERPRPTSTKTRIKTLSSESRSSLFAEVRDQHPLKQGLRRFTIKRNVSYLQCPRPTSTKTRIKTDTAAAPYCRHLPSETNIH